MLDQSALSQLKSLKKDIHDRTPRHEGKVRGTGGRYGFVNTDDNLQFFLSPDEMEKILPGDRIAFRVEETKEGKKQAIVEKLLSSEQDAFVGQYIVKGKGHFIVPDHPTLNRWVFVPPAKRKSAADGQFVAGKIHKHPYPHGKVQAEVLEIIGSPEDRQVESSLMMRKWDIRSEFSEDSLNEASALLSVMEEATSAETREDDTSSEWLTIDSPGSRDLDDALYCEKAGDGWLLKVAIADPSCAVKPGSETDKEALRRASSVYFADQMQPMMPSELSEGAFSLLPGERRPAMKCELEIAADGSVSSYRISNALIESKAKLNYQQVAAFLDDGEQGELSESIQSVLTTLDECVQKVAEHRKTNHLVLDDKPEFRMVLNDQGKVDALVPTERNRAHKLVEECMVAVNRSVAALMAEKGQGLFVHHAGIRTERIGEARALVKEQLGIPDPEKMSELPGFIEVQKQLAESDNELPLQAILARQLERSKFGTEPAPHMGMGLSSYTTFTSPIRKYNDLLVHRIVKQILAGAEVTTPDAETLSAMAEGQNAARMAPWQSEQWLKADWLQRQIASEAITGAQDGHIVQVNSSGFTVRLDDNGIEGIIETRRGKGEWKFDTKTLSHSRGEQSYRLDQAVKVTIQSVNPVTREIKLALCN